MEEEGGEIISEAKEETSQEEDTTVVLQMLLIEDKIRTQVSQVVTGLINQRFNVTTIRNLVIMHVNAGRRNMTKEGKAGISQRTPAFRRAEC